MNNLALFTLCLTLISVSIYAFLFYSRVIRPHRRKHLTYPMFTVRDDLILKVANNQVSRDDPAFEVAYNIINNGIRHYKKITFLNFVKLNSYELSEEMVKRIEEQRSIIAGADDSIKACLADFVHAYIIILYKTSLLLKFLLFLINALFSLYFQE